MTTSPAAASRRNASGRSAASRNRKLPQPEARTIADSRSGATAVSGATRERDEDHQVRPERDQPAERGAPADRRAAATRRLADPARRLSPVDHDLDPQEDRARRPDQAGVDPRLRAADPDPVDRRIRGDRDPGQDREPGGSPLARPDAWR